jgi:hypothetical protein
VSFSIPYKKDEEKPRLVSPTLKEVKHIMTTKKEEYNNITSKKNKTVSTVTKVISPKPVSPISQVSHTESPKVDSKITIQKRQRSPSPSKIRYKTIEVRTILENYENPDAPYITDYRYKTIKKYIHLYKNMPHAVDKIILSSISSNITF